ncbi:hypothetical protein HMPREF9069_01065 [Atopobium sp. oral taxon 810 str. F0209]|nr:hypothetical protein HMPREF9069_01065 [Atopobium sp. oral taxon 810 str. F0209]
MMRLYLITSLMLIGTLAQHRAEALITFQRLPSMMGNKKYSVAEGFPMRKQYKRFLTCLKTKPFGRAAFFLDQALMS